MNQTKLGSLIEAGINTATPEPVASDELLERIDNAALGGVCQMTVGGKHAFLVDIQRLVADARGATPEPVREPRDREADRERFTDPNFNRWLDEAITENGEHTVWSALKSTGDAYAAWRAHPDYTHAAQPVPVNRDDLKALMSESGYVHVTAQEKADFINGFRTAEAHHGITSTSTKGPQQ